MAEEKLDLLGFGRYPRYMVRYLNEESLALLESHWAELPSEAYCESSSNGWKIHLVGDGNIFVQAGFKNNLEVASNELLGFAKMPGQKENVERLLAIFDHIKKAANG